MASKHLTPDQQNFTRLVIVCVDLIKLVLKDVLKSKIKPADLYNAISSCAALTSGKLRPEQQRLCYLPAPNVPDYDKFDVTLLYTLIRNLCPRLKPTPGWGKTPSHTEIQIGDDIERLRIFRNEVHGHCESSNVNDTEFSSRWMDIETAIRRMEALLSSQGLSVNYEKELEKIKDLDLGSEDMEKYKLLLEGMMCLLKKSENEDIPKILVRGENIVTCGELACFKVDVENSSMAAPWSVTWQRVRGDTTEQINISTEKYRGSNDRQLVIQRVSKTDEGEYQAVLSRHNLKVTSNSIFLVAEGDPPVLQTLEVSTGLDGITLHYQYTVTSNSPNVHHITWMKNGEVVGIDQLKYKGGGVDDGRLTITSPTVEDAGQYTCTVSNAVAAVSQSLTLGIPDVDVRENTTNDTQVFTAVLMSIPAPIQVQWSVKNEITDEWTPIDINTEDYKGSTDSLPQPVLVVKRKERTKRHSFQITVKNFIGTKARLIPDERTRPGKDKEDPKVDILSAIFAKKGSTIRFNNLLHHIINEVPEKELNTLKRLSKVMTSKRTSLSNVTSVGEFIDFLLDEGIIKERNVIMMQYLLRSIKRSDLEMKCTEYATENKQALCYYEEIRISGDRRKQIKLHVVNDIENFYDMDELSATVAAIVGCELSSIDIIGIHPESSFIIVMLVNAEFARLLLQKDEEELIELLKFNVDWIQIEDKVIKIQQNVSLSQKMGKKMGLSAAQISSIPGTQISNITMPGIDGVSHISVVTSDRLWVTDNDGRLIQVDSTGHILNDKLRGRTWSWITGSHTVTEEGDLLFTDDFDKVRKLTSDGTVTTLLTADSIAFCIHSSHINGDILVGSNTKVTRYDRTGRELQVIERDNKGQPLYGMSVYITENKNGDILISDMDKRAVVVVDKLGRHRFNYTGRQSDNTGRRSGNTARQSYQGEEQSYNPQPRFYQGEEQSYSPYPRSYQVQFYSAQPRADQGEAQFYSALPRSYQGEAHFCSASAQPRADHLEKQFGYARPRSYQRGPLSSNTFRQPRFSPRGICTDLLGHILVCDYCNDSVHLLDQDGQFLSLLLTRKQHGIRLPTALCLDNQHNLYLGLEHNNMINVYKYLQDTDDK